MNDPDDRGRGPRGSSSGSTSVLEISPSRSDNTPVTVQSGVHEVFVALETECFCK